MNDAPIQTKTDYYAQLKTRIREFANAIVSKSSS